MNGRVLAFLMVSIIIVGTGCQTVGVYETKSTPYSEPIYETQTIPYKHTYLEDVVIPYEAEEIVPIKVQLQPIVTESKTVALLRFAGAVKETNEQAVAGIQLGFEQVQNELYYKENPQRKVEFIRRIALTNILSESQLYDLGPEVYETLKKQFDIDYICTATMLSPIDYIVELQIQDMQGNVLLSGLPGVFEGNSWIDIGRKIGYFALDYRYKTELVPKMMPKTRIEQVQKSETLYREERVQTGVVTKYISSRVKTGEKVEVIPEAMAAVVISILLLIIVGATQ